MRRYCCSAAGWHVDVRVNVGSTARSRLAPPAAAAELLGSIAASIDDLMS